MKKIVVLLLAVVMVLSVVAFAACAQPEAKDYVGEYSYSSQYGTYGAKVTVTVTGDKITKVVLHSDEETGWVNCTASWGDRQKWLDGVENYLKSFEGKTVAEINAATATIKGQDGAEANSVSITHVTGATQSSARVLLAVQNALSKIGK